MRSATLIISLMTVVVLIDSTSSFSIGDMLKTVADTKSDNGLLLMSQMLKMMYGGKPKNASPNGVVESGEGKSTFEEDKKNIEDLLMSLLTLRKSNAGKEKYMDIIKEFLFKPLNQQTV
ncbi:hypothetical protein CEXT_522391 [Caerostris extrusa]|uniref:Uncharacterized protein n=1 Tax=Caerostris extrusa TaxID=172846 RepID=A0AAV4Q6P1_CAEEX|nr:hypothetical protein CEXT_522391 [Caerostris extrusa]